MTLGSLTLATYEDTAKATGLPDILPICNTMIFSASIPRQNKVEGLLLSNRPSDSVRSNA